MNFLDVITQCDNVQLRRNGPTLLDTAYDSEVLIPLYLSESPESAVIGLLRPVIVQKPETENQRSRERNEPEVWSVRVDPSTHITLRNGVHGASVSFHKFLDTPSKRTAAMKELCERWRDTGLFADVCGPKKWREELYLIYEDPFGEHDHPSVTGREDGLNFAFEMERSACALFGLVTYEVHMSIYEQTEEEDGRTGIRVWVPTRALTKPTFPGLLDNTVAGGIPSGMPAFESLVKECLEEASIEADVIRKHTHCVGSISYFFRNSKGWLQPEVVYVYDTLVPPGADPAPFIPRPSDGEVESFELVSQDKLLQQLRGGLFKANCGVVIVDLLIRLGYITPESEPNFMKII
ncbi:hypothetical protein D9619_009890 [Psilocybe cf. subviscida]|uniref:Nudix hydrolase domain-containing protein n=1 Tax=Psilocybe cf. subviscida TaxID=2480587 RepID=A0A8H5BL09_9AGAR|nr:hypothetical protein D9619_009890 [Psilocybe cf. subviscida]